MGLFRGSGEGRRLGDILAEMGAIPRQKADLPPEELRGLVEEEVYHHAIAKLYNKTFIPPKEFAPQREVLLLIPPEWVKLNLLPYSLDRNRLYLVTDNPERVQVPFINLRNNLKRYELYLQFVSTPEVVERAKAQILHAIQEQELKKRLPVPTAYERQEGAEDGEEQGAGLILTALLEEARSMGASDIHLERLIVDGGRASPGVRLRVNGRLMVYRQYDFPIFDAVLAKLKILSNLRLDERRLPQDGRFAVVSSVHGKVEGRVSVVPTLRGEEAVVRLLPAEGYIPTLEEIIVDPEVRSLYLSVIEQPYGIFLVTGPTGSGKSTTLAAMLKEVVARRSGKILTVEDPVEYRILGITQVQVQEEIGLTFARVLRSFLRQDPDVIMVGELRDAETAKIATEAALTGHLVLATLHVNNAVSVFRRLEQMGVERYKINDALLGASAQRLIPKLCPTCSVPDPEGEKVAGPGAKKPSFDSTCPMCKGKGYVGRVGVQEGFLLGQREKEVVATASETTLLFDLENALRKRPEGYKTMYDRGLALVSQGLVYLKDLEEATRVL